MGTGGRSAMAGPTYYTDDFKDAKRPFPAYYNGKIFLYEWMRDMILAVEFRRERRHDNIGAVPAQYGASATPSTWPSAPTAILYVLEYGTGWFIKNDDSRLVRIEFNAGNRKPNVQVAASQKAGAVPLNSELCPRTGTKDFDGDALTYQWKI